MSRSIKSFYELYRRTFLDMTNIDRRFSLGDRGIQIGLPVKGYYDAKNNCVHFDDKTNPFTGEELIVRLAGDNAGIKDRDYLPVIIHLNTITDETPVEDYLFCVTLQQQNELVKSVKKKQDEDRAKRNEELKRKYEKSQEAELDRLIERNRKALLAKINSNKSAINSVIKNRNIHFLMHFTALSNLDSIMKNGLMPTRTLGNKGMKFVATDPTRLDARRECVSLSVEFPNSRYFYKVREWSKEPYIILIVDPKALLVHTNYYFGDNAASLEFKEDVKNYATPESFERMFTDELSIRKSSGVEFVRRSSELQKYEYLPSSVQAEIQTDGTIDPKYIKAIVVDEGNEALVEPLKQQYKRPVFVEHKYYMNRDVVINQKLLNER